MKHQTLVLATLALAILPSLPSAYAAPFAESSDAGVTETTAAVLPAGVNGVTGTLKAGTLGPFAPNPADVVDVDVFAFTLSKPVAGATITAAVAGDDANLLLLKEDFLGLEGDDDDGPGTDSLITRDLPAGTYYIAVGLNNIGAYTATAMAAGDDIWDNDGGSLAAPNTTTPIAFIGAESANPDDTTGQAYTVTFNFNTGVTGIDQAAGAKFSKLRGVGLRNGTGKGQTVLIKGETRGKFVVVSKNTAFDRTVKSTLQGNAAEVDFTAIAVKNGGSNVTAQLKAKGYTTIVKSGSSVRYNFKVNRTGDAPLTVPFLLRSAEKGNPSLSDVAGAKVKLR